MSAEAKAQPPASRQGLAGVCRRPGNRQRLLSLLMPVQRAAEESRPWLKKMVDAGEIFHPLRWTPQQAIPAP